MNELILSVIISSHVNLPGNYNNVHPHVSYKTSDNVIGVYVNSYRTLSSYAGIVAQIHGVEVQMGGVTGYSKPVIPFLVARKKIENNLNLLITPVYNDRYHRAGIVIGVEITN